MFRVVFVKLTGVVVEVRPFRYLVALAPAVGRFAVEIDGWTKIITASTSPTIRGVVRQFFRTFAGKLGKFGESLLTIFFNVPIVGSQARGGVEVLNAGKIYPLYAREVIANLSCNFYFFRG